MVVLSVDRDSSGLDKEIDERIGPAVSEFIERPVMDSRVEEGAYLELVCEVRPPLPKLEEYILSDVGRESLVIALVIACKLT